MGGNSTMIILLVLMVIAFYFLIMRPQRKRQQQQQNMLKTLEPGTRVMTTTGIYGTIVASGDRQLVLETSPGTRITVLKQAIARAVKDEEEDDELRAYQADTPRIPDDLSGLTETSTGESAGLAQDLGSDQAAASDDSAATGATGMAGGSPIQEYTPGGQSNDAEEPGHSTAPWPTTDYAPGGDGDTTDADESQESAAGNAGGSVLGGSSLTSSWGSTTGRTGNESQ